MIVIDFLLLPSTRRLSFNLCVHVMCEYRVCVSVNTIIKNIKHINTKISERNGHCPRPN